MHLKLTIRKKRKEIGKQFMSLDVINQPQVKWETWGVVEFKYFIGNNGTMNITLTLHSSYFT